ncbi:hypothetical protein FRX31_029727 [Thalictrum thalictroides]|uniref:F-box domain-containing protein n=1 Tax=Thalictrum thalictroides TaxID=46969 RepID=A0A7J6V7E3_THATH|nr:hypothetical protein FRX31_029727 [Thalictrum thalictroides]
MGSHTLDCLDRLSNLPQEVIDEILTRMPIRDAVKTNFYEEVGGRDGCLCWNLCLILTLSLKKTPLVC